MFVSSAWICAFLWKSVRSDRRDEILSLREAEFRGLAVKYGAEG